MDKNVQEVGNRLSRAAITLFIFGALISCGLCAILLLG
jgi:hypothetical protein